MALVVPSSATPPPPPSLDAALGASASFSKIVCKHVLRVRERICDHGVALAVAVVALSSMLLALVLRSAEDLVSNVPEVGFRMASGILEGLRRAESEEDAAHWKHRGRLHRPDGSW